MPFASETMYSVAGVLLALESVGGCFPAPPEPQPAAAKTASRPGRRIAGAIRPSWPCPGRYLDSGLAVMSRQKLDRELLVFIEKSPWNKNPKSAKKAACAQNRLNRQF